MLGTLKPSITYVSLPCPLAPLTPYLTPLPPCSLSCSLAPSLPVFLPVSLAPYLDPSSPCSLSHSLAPLLPVLLPCSLSHCLSCSLMLPHSLSCSLTLSLPVSLPLTPYLAPLLQLAPCPHIGVGDPKTYYVGGDLKICWWGFTKAFLSSVNVHWVVVLFVGGGNT